MTTFMQQLRQVTNLTATVNGAATNRSTLDPCLDFFALAGAMRDRPDMAADLFEKAFFAEPDTAVRTLFYLRDVRGGQGEREIFRACFRRLRELDGYSYENMLEHVPFYGRWDDIFAAGITEAAAAQVRHQLVQDQCSANRGEPVSLLAKWLPSENTSSLKTRKLARELRTELGISARDYRKILSKLRAKIRLLEHDMSGNCWDYIDYGKLPSQAHRKHVKAFVRHRPVEYQEYLDSVERGEAKINTGTIYPYELYDMARKGEPGVDAFWDNLPDYTNGNDALVMADVSGSMEGRPMSVSVSLALYFAERNKGAFAGHFLTFSKAPQLVQVAGTDLLTRINRIQSAGWGYNTDMLAAFRAILNAAVASGGAPPRVLYVISDMQFDQATGKGSSPWSTTPVAQAPIFNQAAQEFAECGLTLPHVVFWNVNASDMQAPATILDGRVSLVSGCSPTVFSMAVEGKSPVELMLSVVNGERYERIVL